MQWLVYSLFWVSCACRFGTLFICFISKVYRRYVYYLSPAEVRNIKKRCHSSQSGLDLMSGQMPPHPSSPHHRCQVNTEDRDGAGASELTVGAGPESYMTN